MKLHTSLLTLLLTLVLVPSVFALTPTPSAMMDSQTQGSSIPGSAGSAGSAGAPEAPIQQDRMMMPIEPPQQVTFLGQDQYYSVTFRGNGEAVVTMKAIFSSEENGADTSTLVFEMPGNGIDYSDVTAYQVEREPQCAQYEPYNPASATKPGYTPACISFQEPDYYGYFYGKTSYTKAETSLNGNKLTINLPKPVLANKSGSIILYYRTNEYTKKTAFGGYSFTFKTPKINDKIRNMQIGISTDSDLVLKGSQGQVSYAAPMESSKLMAMDRSATGGVVSAQFDNFYQQIGQGTIVKTASNLLPNDSYSVDGAYGKSTMQVYGKEILLAILIPLLIIALLFFIGTKAVRRMKSSSSAFSGANIMLALGVGLVTAVILAIHTAVFFFAVSSIQGGFYYQYSMAVTFAAMIIGGSIYLLLLVVPSVVVGVKRGVWVGVMTAVSTVIWLVIAFIIISGVIFFLRPQPDFGQPYPVMMRGADVMQSAPATEPVQMDLKR